MVCMTHSRRDLTFTEMTEETEQFSRALVTFCGGAVLLYRR